MNDQLDPELLELLEKGDRLKCGRHVHLVGGRFDELDEFIQGGIANALYRIRKQDQDPLLPHWQVKKVKDLQPYCGALLAVFRGEVDRLTSRGEAESHNCFWFLRIIEQLEAIEAWKEDGPPDRSVALTLNMQGSPDRLGGLLKKIEDLVHQEEVQCLVQSVNKPGVRVSQAFDGSVVLIREGIAERTGLAVTDVVRAQLGPLLLSNEEGRAVATRWLAADFRPSVPGSAEDAAAR